MSFVRFYFLGIKENIYAFYVILKGKKVTLERFYFIKKEVFFLNEKNIIFFFFLFAEKKLRTKKLGCKRQIVQTGGKAFTKLLKLLNLRIKFNNRENECLFN